MPRAAPEARINPRSIVRKAIQSDRWARLRIFTIIYIILHIPYLHILAIFAWRFNYTTDGGVHHGVPLNSEQISTR
jgi:hypothetical protein